MYKITRIWTVIKFLGESVDWTYVETDFDYTLLIDDGVYRHLHWKTGDKDTFHQLLDFQIDLTLPILLMVIYILLL